MTDLSKLPPVDPEVPNAARMYDYFLGGPHNFAAADLREPDAVLDAPGVREVLDLSRPVALLTVSVMQFVHDDEAAGLLADQRGRLAPGRMHALSHVTGDHDTTELAAAEDEYRSTANQGLLRRREQVAALLDGVELVEPGIVDVTEWRPEDMIGSQHRGMWAAIGRIR